VNIAEEKSFKTGAVSVALAFPRQSVKPKAPSTGKSGSSRRKSPVKSFVDPQSSPAKIIMGPTSHSKLVASLHKHKELLKKDICKKRGILEKDLYMDIQVSSMQLLCVWFKMFYGSICIPWAQKEISEEQSKNKSPDAKVIQVTDAHLRAGQVNYQIYLNSSPGESALKNVVVTLVTCCNFKIEEEVE